MAKCLERTRSSSFFLSSWLDSSISASRCWFRRMRSLVVSWGAMSDRCILRSSSSCRLRSFGEHMYIMQPTDSIQIIWPSITERSVTTQHVTNGPYSSPDRHPHNMPFNPLHGLTPALSATFLEHSVYTSRLHLITLPASQSLYWPGGGRSMTSKPLVPTRVCLSPSWALLLLGGVMQKPPSLKSHFQKLPWHCFLSQIPLTSFNFSFRFFFFFLVLQRWCSPEFCLGILPQGHPTSCRQWIWISKETLLLGLKVHISLKICYYFIKKEVRMHCAEWK